MDDLLIARNPDPESRLEFLLRLPIGQGLVFSTSGVWPRMKALYCHPLSVADWPQDADIVERVAMISCDRRGGAIDVVLQRSRENRSQLVFTKARGRDVVFWQSARTRKQSRPNVALPTARAAGLADLQIVVDSHEQYAYRFSSQKVSTISRALPCGDYGVELDGKLIASVERKSFPDLSSSLTSGRLKSACSALAALPRAAVIVEDRYSTIFKPGPVRPAVIADGIAELQIAYPNVAMVFADNRSMAEEWTYRYLGAALAWARTEEAAQHRTGISGTDLESAPPASEPSPRELRAWARSQGMDVRPRGKLGQHIITAWRTAH